MLHSEVYVSTDQMQFISILFEFLPPSGATVHLFNKHLPQYVSNPRQSPYLIMHHNCSVNNSRYHLAH